MKKAKKIKDKNKGAKKTTLLRGASKSLRKFGKDATSSLSGLSTTQKVVGGATLLALGLSYLNKRRTNGATANAAGAEQNLATLDENVA